RTSVSRIASKTQDGGSSAGARLFSSTGALPGKAGPAISPSPGVQAYPGGNGSTSGRQSSSKAFSSEANSVVSSRRAQYSGAMPSTSRAAANEPSAPATTSANVPHRSSKPATPWSL